MRLSPHDRIAELEEENRQLKEALLPEFVWQSRLPLRAAAKKILALLVAQSPNVVSKERLWRFCLGEDSQIRTVDHYLCELRKFLSAHGTEIGTAWGYGNYMTRENAARAKALIDEAQR